MLYHVGFKSILMTAADEAIVVLQLSSIQGVERIIELT